MALVLLHLRCHRAGCGLRRFGRVLARAGALLLFYVLLLPAVAHAQASLVGTVTDQSGGVLAGVVVEATSSALIERHRTVLTDNTGQYALVDLRPGSYALTFTLPGFASAARDGIELTSSFVATIDVKLTIGGVDDLVTVTAMTRGIDRQSTTQRTAMTAEIVSTMPTGRSLANLTVLIPGMTTLSARNQNDVGGTNNLQNIFSAIHGGRVTDQRVYVDGINIRNLQSEGHAINFTPDMSGTEEVAIDYGAATAEEALGGVRASYVPRDGGNVLQMSVFATAADGSFQGSNITPQLRARGLAEPDSLKRTYDVNPTVGGPVVRDKAWFYAATRFQSNQNYVGGIFENRNAGNPNAWSYDPDTTERGLFQITQQSVNARLTWQATPRNKVTAYAERQWRTWDEGNVNRAPEAFSRFRFPENQVAVIGWTSPLSQQLLLDVRGAYHAEAWRNVGGDELFPNNRSLIPVLEQGGAYPGLMYRGKNGTYATQSAPFITILHASLSRVTGAHAIKTGFDVVSGTNRSDNTFNDSGIQYRFDAGTPNQITEFATPYTLAWRMTELGAFVQDRFTLKRLTLNTGVRFDSFATSFPPQHLGPGPLVPDRDITFDQTPWYSLRDVSPRFGAAVDLFGDGRTIARASAGRYLVALSPATGNPIGNLPLSVTRRWDDGDRDFVADCDLLDRFANGECGTISDLSFGGSSPSVRYDPAIRRGWNVRPMDWEFSAAIEREVVRRVTAGASYFRRVYGNFTVQDNLATQPADYTGFQVKAPADARLPGGGGYTIAGLYDLNPDKRGQVANYVTSASQYGRWLEHWNGIDVTLNVRLRDVTIQGGTSTGRTSTDVCEVAMRLPEILGTAPPALGTRPIAASLDQCHVDTALLTQTKWMASYKLPVLDLSVAATVQSTPGLELQASYVAPNALVQPSLGRPLSGGANTTVTLLPSGQAYGDRLNQLDLRVTKLLRFRGARTLLNFDLYNALNAAPVTMANLNYVGDGSRWLQPQAVLPPRLFKISAQLDF